MIATSATTATNPASHHAHVGTSVESSAESSVGSAASSDPVGASDGGWLSSPAGVVSSSVLPGVRVRVGDSAGLSLGLSALSGLSGLSGERVDEGSSVEDGKTGVRDGSTEGPSPEPPPHETRSRPAATMPTRPNRRDTPRARSKRSCLPIESSPLMSTPLVPGPPGLRAGPRGGPLLGLFFGGFLGCGLDVFGGHLVDCALNDGVGQGE